MQAWPSCTYMRYFEKMRLKWRCPCASLHRRGLWDFQPIYSVASQREPWGIWTLSDSMQTDGCVISLLPLPLPEWLDPFSFALLDGPAASEASCFVSESRLQHPCAAPGKESKSSPHWTERLVAFLPLHHCNPAEFLNLDSRITEEIQSKLRHLDSRSDWDAKTSRLCYLKWQDKDFIHRWWWLQAGAQPAWRITQCEITNCHYRSLILS